MKINAAINIYNAKPITVMGKEGLLDLYPAISFIIKIEERDGITYISYVVYNKCVALFGIKQIRKDFG